MCRSNAECGRGPKLKRDEAIGFRSAQAWLHAPRKGIGARHVSGRLPKLFVDQEFRDLKEILVVSGAFQIVEDAAFRVRWRQREA